jgi:hypothetical protein
MKTKSILERLKLIDHLTIEIPIDKQEFVDRLRATVDKGDTGILFSAFEALSSSKKEYKGLVTPNSFKLRRRRKFFDMNMAFATAEGSFRQKDNLLVIESSIVGFQQFYVVFIAFLFLFYVGVIISVIFSDTPGAMRWFIIPFFIFHSALMFGVPYLIMRRGVSRLKYDLEREFYYLTKVT